MSERSAAVVANVDDDGVLHVVFDRPGERVNLLSADVLAALDGILDDLGRRSEVRGVLFRSGKPGTFIAGVDVEDIAALDDAFTAAEAARFGQAVFQKIAALQVPTAVAIDGACMGGGTELALACTTRLASDTPHTRLGLPETRIGIVPGFGGCQRLPRLVGLTAALDLILSGRSIDAAEALRIGLVDVVCPAEYLEREARAALLRGRAAAPGGTRRALERVVESVPALRRRALERARGELAARARPDDAYPAPYRALEAIEAAFTLPLHAGLDVEARLIGELVPSRTAKNLIWLFKSRHALRRGAEDVGARPRDVRKLGILGAGAVGVGLARAAADARLRVRLHDPDRESLLEALRTARAHWDAGADRGRWPAAEVDRRMAWLSPTTDLTGLARADLVIEALSAELDVKREAIAEIERRIDERAVIACQSACLPVSELAAGAVHPERIVGVHVVEPMASTQAVEVVPGPRTSPESLATVIDLFTRFGRVPVVVRDQPGFLVSRIQTAYFAEAVRLLEEGVAVTAVDQAATTFGMADGPFERLDRLGLGAAVRVAVVLREAFGRRVEGLVTALESKVASGRGFYRWTDGRRGKPVRTRRTARGESALSLESVQERLTLTLINEAAACLEDGVARSARDLDVAMILGIGFPAFRGGPLHEADAIGAAVVVDRLSRLSEALGERYRPASILRAMAREDRRFHETTAARRRMTP